MASDFETLTAYGTDGSLPKLFMRNTDVNATCMLAQPVVLPMRRYTVWYVSFAVLYKKNH